MNNGMAWLGYGVAEISLDFIRELEEVAETRVWIGWIGWIGHVTSEVLGTDRGVFIQ